MSTAVRAIIFVCTLVIVAAARKNSLQLGSLIYYKTGRSPSDYENYGCCTKSGYRNGLVSGQFVGMTYDRQSMTITSERLFTLKSLWATAAWNDNLTLAITGSLSFGLLNQKYIKTVVIQATEKTFVEFDDWEGINHLLFNSSGGKPHPAFTSHSATHVVLDDLAIEF
ncbi:unnamed protein product [Didymodactylos carnosus]|uniref:Uncharacterized protein n=1 Tax=Didymodactylos carnosus TaxID=1234261 RepID=A0A815X3A4_9BILA|nr:unnamed protein product [Didymodactylos carnosus]CAF4413710.1 unnamed protein product [Didymodactylos carnosus]